VGVRSVTARRRGIDRRTNTPIEATRRVLTTELELPLKTAATEYLEARAREAS